MKIMIMRIKGRAIDIHFRKMRFLQKLYIWKDIYFGNENADSSRTKVKNKMAPAAAT